MQLFVCKKELVIPIGIGTGYELDDQGFGVRIPETLFQEIKRTGRRTDHLPPTSAEIKKKWTLYPLSYAPSRHRA
jgi:hypothetical protein